MQTPFCSIIVLNYQGEKIITATLDSLVQLDYPKDKYEIIVIDNGSKDKSREVIQNFQKKLLTFDFRLSTLFLPSNLGFAGGNNKGIKIAKGKYVILLNNDCVVEKNWLKELVTVAENDDKIFAVNSKIYLGNTNKIQNAGIRIFSNGYARDIGAVVKNNKQDYEVDKGQYEKVIEIDAACGAAVLYRKSILDKIGFLDESFFLYYEDVEISERAKKNGYKILYAPKAVVHHEHAVSSEEWSPFFIYHSEKGRLLHMIYHFPMKIFFTELLKFSYKSILRIGFAVKHPTRFIQQMQYIKVSLFFIFLWPFYLRKYNSFNIAYEISPLLAKTGEHGEKSGLYRLLFTTIQNLSNEFTKKQLTNNIYLFSYYPDLLDNPPQELKTLLKQKNIQLISVIPYWVNFPFSIFKDMIRFIYKLFGNTYSQEDYKKRLIIQLHKKRVNIIHHSETCFFEAPGFINTITINDLVPVKFPQWCQKKTIENFTKKLAFARKHCQKIICISNNTKKDLLEYWGNHSRVKDIEVIYPPTSSLINIRPFPFSKIKLIIPDLKSLTPNHYFLTYGTYEPRKNLMMLVKAFIELDKINKLNNHSLILAGGKGWGNVYEDIEKFIKNNYHDIKQSPVKQLGFVKDEILASLIKNAKAVVYPTLYEGFGYPIIESLLLNTPVISANNSSLSEANERKYIVISNIYQSWINEFVKIVQNKYFLPKSNKRKLPIVSNQSLYKFYATLNDK